MSTAAGRHVYHVRSHGDRRARRDLDRRPDRGAAPPRCSPATRRARSASASSSTSTWRHDRHAFPGHAGVGGRHRWRCRRTSGTRPHPVRLLAALRSRWRRVPRRPVAAAVGVVAARRRRRRPVRGRPRAATRPRGPASRRGMAFGVGWLAMGMGWMWQLTVPGYLVASADLRPLHGLAALAAPTGRWRVIGRPAAHTLVEALRFSFPFGGVPLASLGIAQVAGPLGGIARVGGVDPDHVGRVPARLRPRGDGRGWRAPRQPGLDRAAVAARGRRRRAGRVARRPARHRHRASPRRRRRPGRRRAGHAGARRAEPRWSPSATSRRPARSSPTRRSTSSCGRRTSSTPSDFADERASSRRSPPRRPGSACRSPSASPRTSPGEPGRITNAQVVVTPDGDVTSRYDKVRRVPFGEYVPLRGLLEALGAPVDQVPTNAVAGTDAGGPRAARRHAARRRHLVGGVLRRPGPRGRRRPAARCSSTRPTGPATPARSCRPSRSRRAGCGRSRPGRWVVQVAPTGFSEFVTPDGDVIDRTAVSEQAVIRRDVELRTGRTWYVDARRRAVDRAALLALAASWVLTLADRSRRDAPSRYVEPDRPSRGSATDAASAVDDHGDRAVVGEADLHLGAEATGRDGGAEARAARRRRARRAARRAPGGRRRSSSAGGRRTCRRTA